MVDPIPPILPPDAGRTVFFVSDGTGITSETLAKAVLVQFDLLFKQVRMPFIDTADKAYEAIKRIQQAHETDGKLPIIFSTLVTPEIATIIRKANAVHMDLFKSFVDPLEKELGVLSTHTMGRTHNVITDSYQDRIEAINYSLAHDDGQTNKNLEEADVILVGVSRSGKTPTSLYLAMQYGIKAANYPLIPEDFERDRLPEGLTQYKQKLFGLTISPERLSQVRNERRPGSKYASLENCRYEINEAERLMQRENIRWMSSTTKSIEEIAATVLQEIKIPTR